MSAEDYHASYGVSKSQLDNLAQSPAHYKYRLDHPEDETAALRIGHWTHAAIFEPDLFQEFAIPTDLDRRGTKEWKSAEAAAEQRGGILLKKAEHQQIADMAKSVRAHPMCRRILGKGNMEVSAFAEDPESGLQLRSRFDWVPSGSNAIADLKTCVSAKNGDFSRCVVNFRYHVQAAYYIDQAARLGLDRDFFFFIAVEKEPPHAVAVYQLDGSAIEAGRTIYRRNLALLADCIARDEWPAYGDEYEVLSLPRWAQPAAIPTLEMAYGD